ncbi:metallophosphoesterase family protein [Labilithrix luteola]|uniref:metallophosphoesterase family protein n=1 Tax=Labilithrix luteola TaxID=1391654 RepID=UPI0023DDDE61|nr:metallophosphoesterase [Labilithrix luteola]
MPVGDLTDQGSTAELKGWAALAKQYRDKGMDFLPLMGNHEDSFSYTVEWIDTMKDFIPKDAVHMSGAEYLDYFVVRENVMIIVLKYYHLPIAFPWIKNAIEANRGKVEHIVVASHDGLVGAKYGETREMIVEGTEGDNRLFDQWDDIRAFFAKHDVLWMQGHEHMYQRSVIRAPLGVDSGSWTVESGNYRMPMYTQVMVGNASYKGYEYRYGERELVQNVIQQKMNTMSKGSTAFDVMATFLSFDNKRVDMASYFTEHTIKDNADGAKELANPSWKLFDKFSRTTNRCERIVFPDSIPASTRPVMQFDPQYWTNDCNGRDGSVARLIDGENKTFNRVESTTRTLSWTPGFSRAQSQAQLMRLAYQFMFQYHEAWTPNLNGANRLIPDPESEFDVIVPETTIDLKEHVSLSWLPASTETVSDILIVSGTQNQTGTFSSPYGAPKNIEVDPGLPGSQPDGTAKGPIALPKTATKKWDIGDAVSDAYTLEFKMPSKVSPNEATLAQKTSAGWKPLTTSTCVVNGAYEKSMLSTPPSRPAGCEGQPLVGLDTKDGNRFWAVLQSDVEVALVRK